MRRRLLLCLRLLGPAGWRRAFARRATLIRRQTRRGFGRRRHAGTSHTGRRAANSGRRTTVGSFAAVSTAATSTTPSGAAGSLARGDQVGVHARQGQTRPRRLGRSFQERGEAIDLDPDAGLGLAAHESGPPARRYDFRARPAGPRPTGRRSAIRRRRSSRPSPRRWRRRHACSASRRWTALPTGRRGPSGRRLHAGAAARRWTASPSGWWSGAGAGARSAAAATETRPACGDHARTHPRQRQSGPRRLHPAFDYRPHAVGLKSDAGPGAATNEPGAQARRFDAGARTARRPGHPCRLSHGWLHRRGYKQRKNNRWRYRNCAHHRSLLLNGDLQFQPPPPAISGAIFANLCSWHQH